MAVEEIFKQLERQTERDLLRQATRITHAAHANVYGQLNNSQNLLKKKLIATELVWFFAAVAIGFLTGYLFYEILSVWLPAIKKDLIDFFLHSNANLIYLLSGVSFIGVYVCRLTIWALSLF
jgi:hypothetical protein